MSFGRTALKWLGGLAATVVGAVSALSFSSGFGASPDGKRLERMKQSPRYGEDGFENYLPEAPMQLWKILKASLGKENTVPEEPIDVLTLDRSAFEVPPESGLRITWLGHSSFIVEIDGVTLLVDPVWGERTSPFSWLGPKRWYAPPLPLEELPPIDAVVISHDRWFLDRICTHILAFECDSQVYFFEGGFSDYEENKKKRLGGDLMPKRIKYKKLVR